MGSGTFVLAYGIWYNSFSFVDVDYVSYLLCYSIFGTFESKLWDWRLV